MASDRIQRRIGSLLDEADQAIAIEDWPTVASRSRSVLAIEPANSDAKAYLTAAERVLGETPDLAPPTPQAEVALTGAKGIAWGAEWSMQPKSGRLEKSRR